MKPLPKTLGELKKSGYRVLPVKDEMRKNLIRMVEKKEPLFPGIIGYDKTVIPGLRNAILSKHDFILLGLRGQAKSRILRNLIRFLDEQVPTIAGCEINDNPYDPFCKRCRKLVRDNGDNVEIYWMPRDERYKEKLATPDVTIADLIGDIDPIKAATEKLFYSDEEVIHYGIIPRTNRGIFSINELPDLPPRIQVGLLNIMEEKDIQIRGFPVRIPLDICIVYSANPEDYTNRGNIITPLKDRIDSQIMTHYPESIDESISITEQEAWIQRDGEMTITIPNYFKEILEEIAFVARKSEFVDQKSGVSARMTISLMENAISNIEHRGIITGEKKLYPRICDLPVALTAMTGKMELVYEGEQEGSVLVSRKIIGQAVKNVFKKYFPHPHKKAKTAKNTPVEDSPYQSIVDWFSDGKTIEISDDLNTTDYLNYLDKITGLREIAMEHLDAKTDGETALAMEFVLEGLHQNSMLSKRDLDSKTTYRDMLKAMLDQVTDDQRD